MGIYVLLWAEFEIRADFVQKFSLTLDLILSKCIVNFGDSRSAVGAGKIFLFFQKVTEVSSRTNHQLSHGALVGNINMDASPYYYH